jgi:hypothetical protein
VVAWLTPSIKAAADTVHATLRVRLLEEEIRDLFIIDTFLGIVTPNIPYTPRERK